MNESKHKHDHRKKHAHSSGSKNRKTPTRFHKDWRAWFVIVLMLVGMAVYVLTMDEAVRPGGIPEPALTNTDIAVE